ncbi:MAG: hypothetical protein KME33_11005 [Aetokthonos hydrillicola CCALA 1050]|nr:hypothetical protein [Aetokthonos hydrillicola CCALA 1050]
MLEGLSSGRIALKLSQIFGARINTINSGRTVPWDKLNITHAEKPKLLCNLEMSSGYLKEVKLLTVRLGQMGVFDQLPN